jgi:Dynamin family
MDIKTQVRKLHLSDEEEGLVHQFIQQAETDHVSVGMFGSFSVGKSLLINRLVERDGLLPTHTNETTAIVTRIAYAPEEGVDVYYKNGEIQHLPLEVLHQFAVGDQVGKVDKIIVSLSDPAWLEKVEIIDTPGRNTKYQVHMEASKQAIIEADAAIYVLPWQGLTLEDIVYLKDLIVYQPNLYFVLNKIDRIEERQGQTIDDVRLEVEKELEKELGQQFPVYALSAKTGLNLEGFSRGLVPQLTGQVQNLKKQRFLKAMDTFLNRHEQMLTNDLKVMNMAATRDQQALEDDIRKIEVEQSKIHDLVNKQLLLTKNQLETIQADVTGYIENTLRQAQNELETKVTDQNHSLDFNKIVENELVSARNTIYRRMEQQLKNVGSDKAIHLSELEPLQSQIHYQEPNFADLHGIYQERLKQISSQYSSKKQRLEMMLNGELQQCSAEEIDLLNQELEVLEHKLLEEYVPQYVKDENHDPQQAAKILKTIGFVGDIAVSVALAAVTAGASAGAQTVGKTASKAGAKTVTKGGTKVAVKAGMKAGAETLGKKVAGRIDQEESKSEKKEEEEKKPSPLQESLKVLDQMTSPVETIATSIGQAIDSARKPDQSIDTLHRQRFFIKRNEIEKRFDAKKMELERLKKGQRENKKVVHDIESKLNDIDKKMQEEMVRLEQTVQRDKERAQARHFRESIGKQLNELVGKEKERYVNWATHEINQVYTILESTLPSYYEEELARWMNKMKAVKEQFTEEAGSLEEKKAILETDLVLCKQMKESLSHGA